MTAPEDKRAHLDTLFAQALELQGEERGAFVARMAAADPGLGAKLGALLQRAAQPAPELEPQALMAGPLWHGVLEGLPCAAEAEDDRIPARIGAWRVLRPIGRGGMGKVYQVQRDVDDFRQIGALKLIRPGVDSDEFLRRFAEERRILASLNHPGIARLLDGGRDADGRPYLVMEYVEGLPVDQDCDARRLDVEQRAALFVKIGGAVAYAHRNLIAHRDLKPSNIIVTAEGEVKLLDFGIAKVLSTTGTNAPLMTQASMRMFTPEYAAPEQVLGQPATTATDIFQLGLLLYELLTGQRAQRIEDLSQSGLEMAICRSPPVRPSLRAEEGKPATWEARRTTAGALRRKLRGDLDNIVLKALRKEPERRYGSVAELIEDIERWQQGRPVRAQPETLRYRTGKFLKRHAWGVAAGMAALALIVSYAITVTFQAEAIARERDRARAEAAKAQQVKTLVLRLFEGADPQQAGGAQLSARELLDRGWAGIETELVDQPEVRVELLDTVGEAYRQLGQYERAGPLFEQALTIARAQGAADPARLARALRSQGRLHSDLGQFERADRLLREALARYRQTLGEPHVEVATTLSDIGFMLTRAADYPAAERVQRDALAMRRQLFGDEHPDVADSLDKLGMILRNQGNYAAAEPLLSEALALRRRLLPATHPQLAHNLSDLALVRSDLGEYDSAEALYRESLALIARVHGAQHPHVATVMNNLARLLQTQRRFDEARALLQQALAIRRDGLGVEHQTVAMSLNDLGQVLADMGDLDAAETHYRQALATYPPDHPWRAATVLNLGRLAEARGSLAPAERLYREALAGQREHYGDDHDRVANVLVPLASVLHRQGRRDEAEAALRQALEIYRQRLGEEHPRVTGAQVPLGVLLAERGRDAEAVSLLRDAVRIRGSAFGQRDVRTAEAVQALASVQRPRPRESMH